MGDDAKTQTESWKRIANRRTSWFVLLVVVGVVLLYWFMDSRFYGASGDWWRELWLPLLCNLASTGVVFMIGLLYFRGEQKLEEQAISAQLIEATEESIGAATEKIEREISTLTAEQRSNRELVVQLLSLLMNNHREAPQANSLKQSEIESETNILDVESNKPRSRSTKTKPSAASKPK